MRSEHPNIKIQPKNSIIKIDMAFDQISFSSISAVNNKYRMIVPEYQRGYSWGESQWKALWDDAISISNLPDREREHYAGSIMISNAALNEDGISEVELIDGQQRWTSIALMLAALGGIASPIIYKDNEPLQTYFDFYALGLKQLSPRLAEYKSFYARNIEDAATFFSKKAKELSIDQRHLLIEIIQHRFKIFILCIQPSFDVHIAFETINNRGKPLSTLEKLKNRLIYLTANAHNKNSGLKAMNTIHRCWKGVYSWLGQGHTLLDDDEFLRAHSLGWFRHEKRADWLSSQLFDKEFSAASVIQPEAIELYVQSLEQAALWWYRLHEPHTMHNSIAKGLIALQRTPSASSKPLLLWALIRLAENYSDITINSSILHEWKAPLEQLITQAERFAVLVILANARQANVGQSDIHRSAYALAHPGISIYGNAIASELSAKDTVISACRHLEALINNDKPETDERIHPEFDFSGYFNTHAVRDVVIDRFRSNDGFYNWQLGKLLINLWEEFLRGNKGSPEKKSWETISWDESIEHIYPQNPDAEWSKYIQFHGNKSPFIKKSVTNSIGNLLLLSTRRNASVSNNPFISESNKIGKSDRYICGCYSEVQVASLCKQWTITQIAARGIAMWRLAQRTWDFELVSDNAPLTEWFPYLFGDQSEAIKDGATTDKKPISNRSLRSWVDKFEKGIQKS